MEQTTIESGAAVRHPALEDLRAIEIFHDLPEEDLNWLRQHMEARELQPGEIFTTAGAPADRLLVIFEGELRAESEGGGRSYVAGAGQVTGMLPYSRLTHFSLNVRAFTAMRCATLHKEYFPEMLRRIPQLNERLVAVMADRIRDTAKSDQQREKLLALGKLSAGLAHELNNPASAARRAADSLGEAVLKFRQANLTIGEMNVTPEVRRYLAKFEYDFTTGNEPQNSLDTLERSDREEELGSELDKAGVPDAWHIAAELVDAGSTSEKLTPVLHKIPREFVGAALQRLTASLTISRLVAEIQSSTGRISELVRVVKEYSYMDQMPVQEMDLHEGIENTLIMLKHRLKNGVEVVREYDRSIPKLCLRGGEMNQVWTNLISNAIDAMSGKGRLRIRTVRQPKNALVEIIDSGSGIPAEIRDRIFDPFFTTKPVNEGTGLGLDIVHRIVTQHRGAITFDSKPGETRFCVTLPLEPAGITENSPRD